MLRLLHERNCLQVKEVRACAPQTARDPSTSVGMTEGAVDWRELTYLDLPQQSL
jgi:hypothetical protein